MIDIPVGAEGVDFGSGVSRAVNVLTRVDGFGILPCERKLIGDKGFGCLGHTRALACLGDTRALACLGDTRAFGLASRERSMYSR